MPASRPNNLFRLLPASALAAALSLAAICLAPLPIRAAGDEPVLTLERAIETALKRSPAIAAARAETDAASERLVQARSGFLPQAQATAAYKRATANSPASPWLAGTASGSERASWSSYNNYAASVGVNQTIWDFGRTSGQTGAARHHLRAGKESLADIRSRTVAAVAGAYYGVLTAEAAVAVAADARRQRSRHLEQATAQVAAGIRPPIDASRARSDLALADLERLDADSRLANARLALEGAIGGRPADGYRVERPVRTDPPGVDSLEEAIRTALARRPDYRALGARIAAAESAVTTARSGWYPALTASGLVAWGGYAPDAAVFNWQVGAGLAWNFFSGFATVGATGEARAAVRSLEAVRIALELSVRNEVEAAWLELRQAEARIAPATTLAGSARETLALAEQRYRTGLGTIIEVTDAQSVDTRARTGMIQAEYAVEVARISLALALGEAAGPEQDKE